MRNIIFFLNLQSKSKILFIILLLILSFSLVLGTSLDLFGLALILPIIIVSPEVSQVMHVALAYTVYGGSWRIPGKCLL